MTIDFDYDEMNRNVITTFRENGGKAPDELQGVPLILVHHIGAKSGTERIAPLVPLVQDDRFYVFASKAGAPENPAWYHNLVAHPEVTVEFGTERFPVTARVLTGTERDEIYAKQAAVAPQFADYQASTTRTIPVIELRRIAG